MEFIVKYWKKNKKRGTQSFAIYGESLTYENILFDCVLNSICESHYQHHYFFSFLDNHLFRKRVQATEHICKYEVQVYDMFDRSKLIAEYEVEMECVVKLRSNDILVENIEYLPRPNIKSKEKQLSEWFTKESTATKSFLRQLDMEGSLSRLKKQSYMYKSTFYINLKVCEDKGYIKDGKIVKRLFITKSVKA
jgi:hypothetical protein